MRIFMMTDSHYYDQEPESIGAIDECVSKANELGSDLFVAVGDIFSAAKSALMTEPFTVQRTFDEYLTTVQAVKNAMDAFTGAHGVISVPGNHEAPVSWWERALGYRYKFEEYDGVLVLALCSGDCEIRFMGYVSAEQYYAMKKAIEAHQGAIPILFCHHLLMPGLGGIYDATAPGRLDGQAYAIVRNHRAVIKLFNTHARAGLVLSGHVWPTTAGSDTDPDYTGITHCYKRHLERKTTSPYYIQRDQYYIDVDPATGAVEVYVWRFDYGDSVLIWSGTL